VLCCVQRAGLPTAASPGEEAGITICPGVFPPFRFLFQMAADTALVRSAWFNSWELTRVFLDGLKGFHGTQAGQVWPYHLGDAGNQRPGHPLCLLSPRPGAWHPSVARTKPTARGKAPCQCATARGWFLCSNRAEACRGQLQAVKSSEQTKKKIAQ